MALIFYLKENFYDPVEDSLNEHLRKTDVFVTEDFYENPETNTNNEFEGFLIMQFYFCGYEYPLITYLFTSPLTASL